MKLVAVAFLIVGMLCNCTLAIAEGPVPFSALMQTAGAQPSVPSMSGASGNSAVVPTQPAHRPMTRGGKIMTGVGIGFVGLGVLFFAAGFSTSSDDFMGSEFRAASFLTGGVFAAGGTTLIIFGTHRRKPK